MYHPALHEAVVRLLDAGRAERERLRWLVARLRFETADRAEHDEDLRLLRRLRALQSGAPAWC